MPDHDPIRSSGDVGSLYDEYIKSRINTESIRESILNYAVKFVSKEEDVACIKPESLYRDYQRERKLPYSKQNTPDKLSQSRIINYAISNRASDKEQGQNHNVWSKAASEVIGWLSRLIPEQAGMRYAAVSLLFMVVLTGTLMIQKNEETPHIGHELVGSIDSIFRDVSDPDTIGQGYFIQDDAAFGFSASLSRQQYAYRLGKYLVAYRWSKGDMQEYYLQNVVSSVLMLVPEEGDISSSDIENFMRIDAPGTVMKHLQHPHDVAFASIGYWLMYLNHMFPSLPDEASKFAMLSFSKNYYRYFSELDGKRNIEDQLKILADIYTSQDASRFNNVIPVAREIDHILMQY